MTPYDDDEVQPPQNVAELLAWLDTFRGDKSTDPDRKKAIAGIERCLGTIVPVGERDMFQLAGRLTDKQLPLGTRERIAANIARAAPLMGSRHIRFAAWVAASTNFMRNFRQPRSEGLTHLSNVIEAARIAQAVLDVGRQDPSVISLDGLANVIDNMLRELEIAAGMFAWADVQIDKSVAQLDRLASDEAAEATVFAEAAAATTH